MAAGILKGTLFLVCFCQLNAQKKTSVDIGVEASKGGNPAISAGVKHENDKWSASGKGTLDTKGNWAVGGKFSREHGNGWASSINGAFDSNHNWKAGVGLGRKGKNWQAGITGTTDSRGNWGVGAGFTLRFRKRSIDWNGEHYIVALHADPCEFSVYDINMDGVIVKSELQTILGDSAEGLFNALDMTTGDGRVAEDEFYVMSRVFINGCKTADRPSYSLL